MPSFTPNYNNKFVNNVLPTYLQHHYLLFQKSKQFNNQELEQYAVNVDEDFWIQIRLSAIELFVTVSHGIRTPSHHQNVLRVNNRS